MRLTEFATDTFEDFKEMFGKFLPIAMETIELQSLPKFHFDDYVDSPGQPTFGMYKNGQNIMHIGLAGRHPVDILRTIAHELVHYKQDTEHQLNIHSGDTGSPEENQAHQLAGVVMRHFNKQYPEYLHSKPVVENFADGKGPGRPGDSQRHGIPKKATMAELEKASHSKGRKGQLARWQLNMRRGRKK
jgi:hypothetical protein